MPSGTVWSMDALASAAAGRDLEVREDPVDVVAAMAGCPQTAAFHAEGDVATHTRLVYGLAREQAEALRPGLAAYGRSAADWQAAALRLAALLHDVGKPVVTQELSPGVYGSRGHETAGAALVAELAQTHPVLLEAPLGVPVAVRALVRDHMWTYAADRIPAGSALRASHAADPLLLQALWDADGRGRVCDDPDDVADRVAFARLVLDDLVPGPDSRGLVDVVDPDAQASPRARREVFRAHADGDVVDVGAASARLAAAERHGTGGSLTYTVGLPGLGKSTWARTVWQQATGGEVLSAEGSRRRDRKAATAAVLAAIPRLLAAGAPVCVDATHLVRETRDVLVTYAGRYGAQLHAVYFRAPLALALRRQRDRDAADAVPSATVAAMAGRLSYPTPDEYESLTVVEPSGAAWDYSPATRWLPAAEAVATAPVTAATWRGRTGECRWRTA